MDQRKQITSGYSWMNILFGVTVLFMLLSGACSKEKPQSRIAPAKSGLDGKGAFHISPEDRCPVCGMDVSMNERYSGAVQLKDDRTFYTCGTGCLLRIWLMSDKLLGVQQSEIRQLRVQEFFSGKVIRAEEVVFVAGSDFMGPMGRSVAPVSPDQVESFKNRHGGTREFRLEALTPELWQAIAEENMKRP